MRVLFGMWRLEAFASDLRSRRPFHYTIRLAGIPHTRHTRTRDYWPAILRVSTSGTYI